MRVSRRGVLAGAAALPIATQARGWRWEHHGDTVLLYDPALPAAQTFAESGRSAGRTVLALEGDRIRMARDLFAGRPALVRGVSRQADAVLVEEVAQEAGYYPVGQRVDGDVLDWTLAPRNRA
ncbi:hypothetical protein [Aurantiacibacter gilvus]|uniref:Uncharacterized protein n=1 Tax=Aurantiacibacter gilvus TaxID=3139141 RepID=A0ABU9IHB1_9SPHN